MKHSSSSIISSEKVSVVPHDLVDAFKNNGTTLQGIATSSQGAKQYEVWKSSFPVGGCSPKHKHDTEEVFIFLSGKGKIIAGGNESHFQAPCTVICPAHIEHQFFNTGDTPTEQIVVVGIGSVVVDEDNQVMDLPWRK